MDTASILLITFGTLIIITRCPLIIAPKPALDFAMKFVETDARVRLLSLVLAAMAAALLLPTLRVSLVGTLLRGFGWFCLTGVVWMQVWPAKFRSMVGGVIAFMRDDMPPAAVRGIGVLAVGIGLALIYVGLAPA